MASGNLQLFSYQFCTSEAVSPPCYEVIAGYALWVTASHEADNGQKRKLKHFIAISSFSI
ncbi:hypothetical protein SAMN05216202_1014 [Pseudomonas mucidolens]|uniref:Uncharacterized protein n=1 Tax=Pseudomonas mucidolens TaxID=46679 RepID=A0A1H2M4T6_9PSED|nr:hypothetical protein SAMN05216202_1014 [Pseudomonas mucidolens]SQH34552.1 Uncharacterised protein [Pseudomonas mucidolens]